MVNEIEVGGDKQLGKTVLTNEYLRDIMANENLPEDMRSMAGELLLARGTSAMSLTGGEAVLKMRDEFLQLAKCHLEIRNYRAALSSIGMVQALEKFEAEINITGIVWPAEVECGEFNNWLKGNEDTGVDQ